MADDSEPKKFFEQDSEEEEEEEEEERGKEEVSDKENVEEEEGGEEENEENEGNEGGEGTESDRFDNDRTVFVGRLWRGCTESELRSLFSGSGAVTRVRLPTHRDSGRSMGVAFVEFAAPEHAARALRLDGRTCQGCDIKVKMASSHAAATRASRDAPWRRRAGMGAVDDDCTVYVGNLSFATDEKTLVRELGRFGRITRVNIPLWHDSGRKRGFALVEFAAQAAAHTAAEKIAGKIIDGRTVVAKMYTPVDPAVHKKKRGAGPGSGKRGGKRPQHPVEDKNYAPQTKKPRSNN